MFRSDYHVGGSIECIRASCIDTENVVAGVRRKPGRGASSFPVGEEIGRIRWIRLIADVEIDFGTRTSSDPVALQQLDRFRPVDGVQLTPQTIGIGGDVQHPLL